MLNINDKYDSETHLTEMWRQQRVAQFQTTNKNLHVCGLWQPLWTNDDIVEIK